MNDGNMPVNVSMHCKLWKQTSPPDVVAACTFYSVNGKFISALAMLLAK